MGGGGGVVPDFDDSKNNEMSSAPFLYMTKFIPEGEEGADCNEESEKRDGVTWNVKNIVFLKG